MFAARWKREEQRERERERTRVRGESHDTYRHGFSGTAEWGFRSRMIWKVDGNGSEDVKAAVRSSPQKASLSIYSRARAHATCTLSLPSPPLPFPSSSCFSPTRASRSRPLYFSAFQRYRALYVPARHSDAPRRCEKIARTRISDRSRTVRKQREIPYVHYVLLYVRRMYTFNFCFRIKTLLLLRIKMEGWIYFPYPFIN